MSFVIRTYKTLRNHWKKSTFAFILLTYSGNRLKTRYQTNALMRACCEEAAKYGDEILPLTQNPRAITVILNPVANKRSAKSDFEKYCEPLLHLAGISVDIVQTNYVGHAKELIESIPENHNIVVAGGDGTLCETITGILRKNEWSSERRVGVLPLGRVNRFGSKLFPEFGPNLKKVRQLTDATMAIIRNETRPFDVMKLEVIETEKEIPGKPIYAVSGLEWGAFRDAFARRDSYWFYGGLRNYATFIFNGYKSSLCWDCKADVKYTPPCDGCNNCRKTILPKKVSWVDVFIPRAKTLSGKDYDIISNENCSLVEEVSFKTTNLNIVPTRQENHPPHLSIMLDKANLDYGEFVSEGWRRLKGDLPKDIKNIKARTIELFPLKTSETGKEIWFNIDNEEFELRPIKISLLPSVISIFCKNSN